MTTAPHFGTTSVVTGYYVTLHLSSEPLYLAGPFPTMEQAANAAPEAERLTRLDAPAITDELIEAARILGRWVFNLSTVTGDDASVFPIGQHNAALLAQAGAL